ncbi:MarR family transcriptional regulator [Novosphingobium soli]|uniref:MarR family transcriptional regulator n=1 Tax=Novosphingobium soli TaxID=574956 RepID=A0ABV6D1X2_9SPHN
MHDDQPAGADFAYPAAGASAGERSAALAIYADRPHVLSALRSDVEASGALVVAIGTLADLVAGEGLLGDVVLVDCPCLDGAVLAALARLDMRAARGGTRLIVSTTVQALDDVFACMDQSNPVLLVDPNRAERVIALGQVLAGFPAARLRELSEDDRLMLLRLTEQVGRIAGRIERLDARGFSAVPAAPAEPRPAHAPPPLAADGLPDPRLLRRIIRQRQLRARFLGSDLFADPAWDMMLDLAAARAEGKRVSVTSLCIAAGVPPTTALRWIGQLVDSGIFVRMDDPADKRRAFIALSDTAAAAMASYFAEIALGAPAPV